MGIIRERESELNVAVVTLRRRLSTTWLALRCRLVCLPSARFGSVRLVQLKLNAICLISETEGPCALSYSTCCVALLGSVHRVIDLSFCTLYLVAPFLHFLEQNFKICKRASVFSLFFSLDSLERKKKRPLVNGNGLASWVNKIKREKEFEFFFVSESQ